MLTTQIQKQVEQVHYKDEGDPEDSLLDADPENEEINIYVK